MSGDLEDVKLDSETDLEPEVSLKLFLCACLHSLLMRSNGMGVCGAVMANGAIIMFPNHVS